MNTRYLPLLLSAFVLATGLRAQETFDDAMKRATTDYASRLRKPPTS